MKTFKDYILPIKNALSEELCDQIVNEYKNSDEWEMGTLSGLVNKELRNCKLIGISKEKTIFKNYAVRKNLDDELFFSVGKAVILYKEKFSQCKVEVDEGYTLLQYEKGQFIKNHIDTGKESVRSLSCSIGLNNEFEGGEFSFFNKAYTYRLNKGEILLFPSCFTYPHEILPITSGTRYSIITWLK
jgi:predicted 2-oxoglutarate/Fe(II)-dependent dioxygenase YbiX